MLPLGLRTRWQAASHCAIEFVIGFGALGFVPRAFIDADHASGVAGDAAIGKEIGRVGEDEVNGFGGHDGENFAAVALENFDVVRAVVEGGGHGDKRNARAGRFHSGRRL